MKEKILFLVILTSLLVACSTREEVLEKFPHQYAGSVEEAKLLSGCVDEYCTGFMKVNDETEVMSVEMKEDEYSGQQYRVFVENPKNKELFWFDFDGVKPTIKKSEKGYSYIRRIENTVRNFRTEDTYFAHEARYELYIASNTVSGVKTTETTGKNKVEEVESTIVGN